MSALRWLLGYEMLFPAVLPRRWGLRGMKSGKCSRHVRTYTTAAPIHTPLKLNTTAAIRPYCRFVVDTLDPHRLSSADFVDISNVIRAKLIAQDADAGGLLLSSRKPPRCNNIEYAMPQLPGMSHTTEIPFPDGTQGYFYYHHYPHLPPESGEVRFRVVQNPEDDFSSGKDLEALGGGTWHLPLYSISTTIKHSHLRSLLLRDGLVTPEAVEMFSRSEHKLTRKRCTVICSFGQPFELDCAILRHRMHICDGKDIEAYRWRLTSWRKSGTLYVAPPEGPLKGRLLCCFEASTLPEHAHSKVIVVRVLKILEPLEVGDFLDQPVEGELLKIKGKAITRNILTEKNWPLRLLFSREEHKKAQQRSEAHDTAHRLAGSHGSDVIQDTPQHS